jgi:hypothetical protein
MHENKNENKINTLEKLLYNLEHIKIPNAFFVILQLSPASY